ncbi:Glycosyl transferase family 2 [Sulfitobacter marinus]|uniref:Glycosyl transferase family 2 n=1 Tax=Sulfitobacter marinus TaxID=394264 RepID=A0A1I6VHE3_9RHOB|nr:glycosyltransferase family A protein [Sulfitobacter marinus]SFT13148.1 Glycosyl transferase family 2 [Sulfitobacter marinus]
MTRASIIVPAFNVADSLDKTMQALLAQTYGSYEIIIVDDGSCDATPRIAAQYSTDPRVSVLRQANRGFAAARNVGISVAQGEYIGFCNAGDIWMPTKLARHVTHLRAHPEIGVSFSGSAVIDGAGAVKGRAKMPCVSDITPACILKRNPVDNGSAIVIRRAALNDIAYRPRREIQRDWYFDETFRHCADIECWTRMALTTDWRFEGIQDILTHTRDTQGGLCAKADRQLEAWERMVAKLTPLDPAFFRMNTPAARAYQLRDMSRRAIRDLDGVRAVNLTFGAMAHSRAPLIEDPVQSLCTICTAAALFCAGPKNSRRVLQMKAALCAPKAVS